MLNRANLSIGSAMINHSVCPDRETTISSNAHISLPRVSELKRTGTRRLWWHLAAIISITLIVGTIAGTPIGARADSQTSLMNKVDAVLKKDRRLNGASCYTAAPGVIVLYGKVFDDKSRTLAEKTALKVHGVKKVINTLTTTTGTWLEEEVRINDTLQLNGFQGCTARVIGKDAYLSGQVSSDAEKQRAARVISSISNVRVVNFIRVAPGSLF
jgi:osmotically-inducible protein OsmY